MTFLLLQWYVNAGLTRNRTDGKRVCVLSYIFYCRLQDLGVGILVAALIGFLESIAIAKAFGMCCLHGESCYDNVLTYTVVAPHFNLEPKYLCVIK